MCVCLYVLMCSLALLVSLTADDPAHQDMFDRVHGVGSVCDALRHHSSHLEVSTLACQLLAVATANHPVNAREVVILNGIKLMLAAMQAHLASSALQQYAALALSQVLALSTKKSEVFVSMVDAGCLEICAGSIARHSLVRVSA